MDLTILRIAGGETTASTLAGTIFHLLKPASHLVYRKLCQEVRSRYRACEEIHWSSAQHLPYLQAAIKEGLRIFPPGHGLPRESPGQSVDHHWVPKGIEVYTSPWTINHSAEYFTDPTEFLPERWLKSSATGATTDCTESKFSTDVLDASQPFLLGPRACLGRNFALLEMSLILAKMVWRYDMELLDKDLNFERECRIHVMWWKPEVNVTFIKVDGALPVSTYSG